MRLAQRRAAWMASPALGLLDTKPTTTPKLSMMTSAPSAMPSPAKKTTESCGPRTGAKPLAPAYFHALS